MVAVNMRHSDPASRNDYCGGCHFSVEGPAIKALDRIWHRECFQCEVSQGQCIGSEGGHVLA